MQHCDPSPPPPSSPHEASGTNPVRGCKINIISIRNRLKLVVIRVNVDVYSLLRLCLVLSVWTPPPPQYINTTYLHDAHPNLACGHYCCTIILCFLTYDRVNIFNVIY